MNIVERFRTALPPFLPTFAGAIIWAVAMSASAGLSIYLRHWYRATQAFELIAIFFAGGLLAWPIARFVSRFAAIETSGTRRIAADILATIGATLALTALIFALYFRYELAQWHHHPISIGYFIGFAFTIAGAIAQFLVLGLRLFLPALVIGLPAYLFWKLFAGRR